MWHAVHTLLGPLPGTSDELGMARAISALPMRFGVRGLRSAERMANAATLVAAMTLTTTKNYGLRIMNGYGLWIKKLRIMDYGLLLLLTSRG